MHFTNTPLSLLLSCIFFSASTSAQGLNQNQTCANACTAAQACDHQCEPGTTYDPIVNTNIWADCLCQSGCLCTAEICLQCCEAAGVNGADAESCPFLNLPAANVLDVCTFVSWAKLLLSCTDMSSGEDDGSSTYLRTLDTDQQRSQGWTNARTSNPRKRLFRIR